MYWFIIWKSCFERKQGGENNEDYVKNFWNICCLYVGLWIGGDAVYPSAGKMDGVFCCCGFFVLFMADWGRKEEKKEKSAVL